MNYSRTNNGATGRLLLPLLLICALPIAAAAGTVRLRDITVTPSGNRATITFLLSGPVDRLVVENRDDDRLEIRMRSVVADSRALGSALPKPGLRSLSATIDRGDVLVTRLHFARSVSESAVLRRSNDRVVVGVVFGKASIPLPSLDRIVIDAGHGGGDPGATGLDGVVEKRLNLQIARRLKKGLARRMPRATITMTRDDDRTLGLRERTTIANDARAEVFISVHCNATESRPSEVRGFECWTFRPAARPDTSLIEDARGLASGRTRLIRPEASGPTASDARRLATVIHKRLGTTKLPDRGVRGAAFWVLAGTAMPALLVECGYLTNRRDLSILTSAEGQQQIADAIADGVVDYARAKGR